MRGAVTRRRRGRGNDSAGFKGTEAVDGPMWRHAAGCKGTEGVNGPIGTHAAGFKGTEADLVTESVQLGQQYLAEPCGVLRKPALILAEKATAGL